MESLLCNEVWPMSPNVVQENDDGCNSAVDDVPVSLLASEQDCEEAFGGFVDKESRCMPEPGYLNLLLTDDFLRDSRFKAVNWIVKSQKRMNLSLGTVFIAVNCLDRFVSLSQCHGWKDWMFELLPIACLSVASKFNETNTLPLSDFQGNGLNHSFASSLIQRMELRLLKGLGWRLASTTPFSYTEFLIQSTGNNILVEDLMLRVSELLISALIDPNFMEFQPCVIAMSAFRCVFGDSFRASLLTFLDTVICRHQDDLSKCRSSIEKLQHSNSIIPCGNSWNGPSSPVTVLLKEDWSHFCDCLVDRCVPSINMPSCKKRKREEEEQ